MERISLSTESEKSDPGLESREGSREGSKEAIFSSLVINHVLETTEESLENTDYDDNEIEAFKETLAGLSSEEIKGVLSLPYELRETVFASYKKRIENGDCTPERMVDELNTLAKEHGFTIGYHASNINIDPEISAHNMPKKWNIIGYEMDDRDDVSMAYYSLDYENVYRKHAGKYLYLVRAETGEQTSHKKDLSNNWGRAPQLSVIEKIDIREFDEKTEKIYQELSKNKKTT
jgi:hypothetical protein